VRKRGSSDRVPYQVRRDEFECSACGGRCVRHVVASKVGSKVVAVVVSGDPEVKAGKCSGCGQTYPHFVMTSSVMVRPDGLVVWSESGV